MQHFYDKQIRRYLTQIVRMLSGFSYSDGKGTLTQVPIMYGDLTRQVASIIRDNSENKIPSAPRMSVYVNGLEMDTTRLGDSSYVNKLNIRERAVNDAGVEYIKKEGKNYTVERLMPTPYKLTVNVDIWTTNTDQKLQILEQILCLFNPSLEIQTTDNYIDWTSLSVVNLDNVTWSSRSIPSGTESEIDVSTLTFNTPIYISPPVKVKKLGVITNIITAVFDDNGLQVNFDDTAYAQSLVKETPITFDENALPNKVTGKREALTSETTLVTTSHNNYDIVVYPGASITQKRVKLLGKGVIGAETWTGYLKALPFLFQSGITELRLQRSNGIEIIGPVAVNPIDETELLVNLDPDTMPSDTVINGPTGNRTGIQYIVDPTKFNPKQITTSSNSPRILLLGNIGHSHTDTFTSENAVQIVDTGRPFDSVVAHKVVVDGVEVNPPVVQPTDTFYNGNYVFRFVSALDRDAVVEYELFLDQDGPAAWKNTDGTDFVASANDIVEWDGSDWSILFKSNTVTTETFVTNENTYSQYKWTGSEWILSIEGEYPDGTWRIAY